MKVTSIKTSTYHHSNGQIYDVKIIYKSGKKNITYRFRDNTFIVTSPNYVTINQIFKGIAKYADKLIKISNKPAPIKEDEYMYLFGIKTDISKGVITFNNYPQVVFEDKEDMEKKLKVIFSRIVKDITLKYLKEMKIKDEYKVRVKKMTSRYGSNSRSTKTINYSTLLMHYDIEIIKSVIVHECAHCLVFDHSKKFYDIVYKYCPEYDTYRKKLIKGIYK